MEDKKVGELWVDLVNDCREWMPAGKLIRKLVEEREAAFSEHWCGTYEELRATVLRQFGIPPESWKP